MLHITKAIASTKKETNTFKDYTCDTPILRGRFEGSTVGLVLYKRDLSLLFLLARLSNLVEDKPWNFMREFRCHR